MKIKNLRFEKILVMGAGLKTEIAFFFLAV